MSIENVKREVKDNHPTQPHEHCRVCLGTTDVGKAVCEACTTVSYKLQSDGKCTCPVCILKARNVSRLRSKLTLGEAVKDCSERRCRHGEHTIELDCPPGSPRPGDLIATVIEGTGLPLRDDVGRSFGNWIWNYNDICCTEWDKVQPTLKERITALYNQGTIRYGSW